ncbi:MAG: thymidine kinase [Oligoflexia bacterium]|nr:thymidine kinase [Oligoflexia bacterium]
MRGEIVRESLAPGRGAGWIEVIVGSMFSGKTEELIRRLRRAQIAKQKVQVFKPRIDNRYSHSQVASHSEQRTDSLVVDGAKEILSLIDDNTRVVAIDEGQFFDSTLLEVAQKLANRGIRVIIAGLDTDWRGLPFEPMPQLMAIAEMVTKHNAICVVCGGLASRTQRLSVSTARVQVGAADIYEARCRGCFDPKLAMDTKPDVSRAKTRGSKKEPRDSARP